MLMIFEMFYYDMLIARKYLQPLIADGVLVEVGLRRVHGLSAQGRGPDRALGDSSLVPCSLFVSKTV